VTPARLLVINNALLGARTFGTHLLPQVATHAPALHIDQILLTERLTRAERLVRRAICQRFWTDRWPGWRNLDFARFRMEMHAGLLAARRLRQRREAHDALLFYRPPTAYASLGLMRRVPSLVAIDCTQACILSKLRSRLERATLVPNIRRDERVFSAARLVLTSSRWAATLVGEMYPACRTPVEPLPPLVHVAAFDAGWGSERATRAAAGARPHVLFVGGDFRDKGGFDLLQAWRDARLHDHADLDLVTGWPLNRRDLPPGVAVHAGVAAYSEPWRDLFRRADVFVLPTRQEAFANVFLEAAAAGLPRIGTREHAIPEVISDGETGFLITPGDRHGLIARLREVVTRPALRLALGAAARTWAMREASPARYATALEGAVRRVLAPRGAGVL
jgi:alpha-maltose-1-phosphate synthase